MMGALQRGMMVVVGVGVCLPGCAGGLTWSVWPTPAAIPWWQEHGLLGWLFAGVMLGVVIVRGAWGAQTCAHHHHEHAPQAHGADCACAAAAEEPIDDADLVDAPEALAVPVAAVSIAEAPALDPQSSGALLASLQHLRNDFDAMVQGVQRYSSQREVQLQQWQLLCQEIVRRLLPVLDNLSPFLEDDDERVAEVAQLAYTRMMTELSTIGVTPIVPQVGELFDARYHQLAPDSTGVPPYQVAQVCAVGFRLIPRVQGAPETVLRPAEVIGASRPVAEPELAHAGDADAQVYVLDDGLDLASIDLSAYATDDPETDADIETENA